MRYSIIDGFRGYFLLFMCVTHLDAELDVLIGKLNHHALGWVEDAQGFVFISGLVIGMVYGGTLLKRGYSAMRQRIWGRVRTLFTWHGALVFGFALLAVILAGQGFTPHILSDYRDAPAAFTAASLLLVTGSAHMGILPMYIAFLAVTPFLLVAIRNGHGAAVLLGSGLVWFLGGQTILLDQITNMAEVALSARGTPLDLGIYFNIFGWQILFVVGLVSGYHLAAGKLNLSIMQGPEARGLFFVALVGIIALAVLDRVVNADGIISEFSAALLRGEMRSDLSLLHLIAFALDLYAVLWLLTAGQGSGIPILMSGAQILRAIMTWRPLVFLGQHSLAVFAGHLVIVYAVAVLVNGEPISELLGSIVLIVGVALLFAAAGLNAVLAGRGHAAPPSKPFSTPVRTAPDWRRPVTKGAG